MTLSAVKKWKYPVIVNGKEKLSANTYYEALMSASTGFYPVSVNKLMHCGVHFDLNALKKLGNEKERRVHCIADGEIIAYRVNDRYQKIDKGDEVVFFSTGFVLVRHLLEMEHVEETPVSESDTTENNTNTEGTAADTNQAQSPSNSTDTTTPTPPTTPQTNTETATDTSSSSEAATTSETTPNTTEPAKEKQPGHRLYFYSLYMHLADTNYYDKNPNEPTPAFWEQDIYRVRVGHKDLDYVAGLNIREKPDNSNNKNIRAVLQKGTKVNLNLDLHDEKYEWYAVSNFVEGYFSIPELKPIKYKCDKTGTEVDILGWVYTGKAVTTSEFEILSSETDITLAKEKKEFNANLVKSKGLRVWNDFKDKNDKKLYSMLPEGTQVKISGEKKTKNYVELTEVVRDGNPTLPLPAEKKKVWYDCLENIVRGKKYNEVVVLEKPFPIKAGDLVGHIGHNQNKGILKSKYSNLETLPLGEGSNDKEFCPHLHVECFTCEDLPSYITQTQAEASKIPEGDKAFLGIAKQVKLLEKEAASDTTVGKPYAKTKINVMSQDVKVAWLQIEIYSSETEKKTLWIKNEAAIAKVAKPNGELSLAENTAAWTKHPLQASNILSSTLIVGTALQVEMNDAKLSLSDNRAIDAQGNLWLKVDVLDDKNRKRSGWVLVNGEGAKRVSCWDWFDFMQIKETATLKELYLDADKSLKRNKDNHSLSQYKPTIKETLSILDKQYHVETKIYTSIKEASFKGVADKPMLFTALSRLLINYESEWYSEIDAEGKMPKWEALNSELTENAKNILAYLQTGDEAKLDAYLSRVGKAKDSPEAKGFETLRREISRFPADYKESPSKKLTKEQFESYAKMEALEKQVTAWEKTKEKIKKMLWWDDVAKGLSKLNQQNDTPPKNGEATSATTATTTATDTTPPATLSDDGKAWFIHPVTIMQLAAYKEIKFSKKGIAFLKKWEGLRLKPYDDQTGKTITNYTKGATIGIGHLIKSSEEFELYKNGINEATAEKLLSNDLNLKGYIKVVSENIKITLHQYEFDALVAFSFNIGIGGFKSSTVVKMINNPKGSYTYNSLEEAWLSWSNSQGKFNQGVNNRRRSEYYLFKNNKYTTYSHLDGEYKEI
ncbi:lysozyme [Gilliamella sp. WF3-4]|uniref:lysozyme n=1 Tax=Gilliamella sp. WF3-4 TaxID=3120255 RepID=UPI00080DEE21|nr:lysozyme [Gilliamella apicola]OCG18102.1 hypothetical protein A9G47_06270 [Gilliamella apicola]